MPIPMPIPISISILMPIPICAEPLPIPMPNNCKFCRFQRHMGEGGDADFKFLTLQGSGNGEMQNKPIANANFRGRMPISEEDIRERGCNL